MRSFVVFIPVLLALGASPSAADVKSEDAPKTVSTEQPRIEKLFGDLKRARNEKAAERIADGIRNEWARSGSASIDLLMQWSENAIKERKFAAALDFLDHVVVLQPRFAEGWNRRATVHFMMDNYGKSMRDISRALQLEPRHFGALTGMAMIMKNTGRKELALEAYQRALDVYPMMRSAQKEISTLAEELAGEAL